MSRVSGSAVKKKKSENLLVNPKVNKRIAPLRRVTKAARPKKRIAPQTRRVTKAARPKERGLPKRKIKPKIIQLAKVKRKPEETHKKFAGMIGIAQERGKTIGKEIKGYELVARQRPKKEKTRSSPKEILKDLSISAGELIVSAVEKSRKGTSYTLNNILESSLKKEPAAPKNMNEEYKIIPSKMPIKKRALMSIMKMADKMTTREIDFNNWARQKAQKKVA